MPETQSLSGLLKNAEEMNGVRWGAKVGLRGGKGKTFLETGPGASILDWLSSEAHPGQFGELDMFARGGGGARGEGNSAESEAGDEDEEEEEFSVGRGRRWQTVGSRGGGRYG